MRAWTIVACGLVMGCSESVARADEKSTCLEASESAQHAKLEGNLRSARASLLVCSREICPAVVRQDCNIWLSEVTASLPTVVVAARSPAGADLSDVRVSVDGEPFTEHPDGKSRAVDPGLRVFKFERAGESQEIRVVVRQGERDRLVEVTFGSPAAKTPEPSPATKPVPVLEPSHSEDNSMGAQRAVGIGLSVAGIAGLGTAAALGLVYNGQVSELRDSCGPTRSCTDDQLSSASSLRTAAGVVGGVSGAFLLGGAILFFSAPRSSSSRAGARPLWYASPTPSGAFAGVAFRY